MLGIQLFINCVIIAGSELEKNNTKADNTQLSPIRKLLLEKKKLKMRAMQYKNNLEVKEIQILKER